MTQSGGRARHTFGSDPDADSSGASESGWTPPTESHAVPLDLSSRPVWWLLARERAGELLEGEHRRVVTRLMAHLEAAWSVADELAAICESAAPTQDGEVVPLLLEFLRIEVLDLFTGLARSAALTADVTGGGQDNPDPNQIDGLGKRFSRNLLVLQLASSNVNLPQTLRGKLTRACGYLSEWYPEFSVLAQASARFTS